jgi:hypothetical protein
VLPGTSLVQLEGETQRVADCRQFVVAHSADEFAESFRRDGGCLFDEHLSRVTIDVDRSVERTVPMPIVMSVLRTVSTTRSRRPGRVPQIEHLFVLVRVASRGARRRWMSPCPKRFDFGENAFALSTIMFVVR